MPIFNRLIVQFQDSGRLKKFKMDNDKYTVHRLYNIRPNKKLKDISDLERRLSNTVIISSKNDEPLKDLYETLEGSKGEIISVQYDQKYELYTTTDPVQLNQAWWFDAINCQQALQPYSNNGSRAIKIAVIDTGIDHKHKDLKKSSFTSSANRRDFTDSAVIDSLTINGDGLPIPLDENGDSGEHGTHVAGIIAALNNNIHAVGVANKASLMNLRAYPNATESSLNLAILYAIKMNAKVINASWGTRITPVNGNVGDSLKLVIDYANECGVVVVCAAGNGDVNNPNNNGEEVDNFVPARFENVIAVGSINKSDTGTYIKTQSSNYGRKVIGAPGVNILSLLAYNYGVLAGKSGSSMAAGFVTGLVARMLQKRPDLIPATLPTGYNTAATILDSIIRINIAQDPARPIGQSMIDVDNTLNNL